MNNIDSIIFDLDGTLWSTLNSTVEVSKEIKKRHSDIVEDMSTEVIKSAMGCTFEETAKKYYGYLDKETRERYTKEAIQENTKYLMKHGGTLYNGVEEVIKLLSKNYKLYIVSNCIEGYIESFLETSNLKDYFPDFENNGRTGLAKGENIKLLIKRNHLSNPIYVGDTDKDREAAEEAKIPFIYATYGFGAVEKYNNKIDNIYDLLTILKIKNTKNEF